MIFSTLIDIVGGHTHAVKNLLLNHADKFSGSDVICSSHSSKSSHIKYYANEGSMRHARGDTRCELWPASIDSLQQSCDDVTLVKVKVDFQQPRSTK